MSAEIAKELREAAARLRRTPLPLADVIPLMLRAADVLDAKQRARDDELIAARVMFDSRGKPVGCVRVCQHCRGRLPLEALDVAERAGLLFCSERCADEHEAHA